MYLGLGLIPRRAKQKDIQKDIEKYKEGEMNLNLNINCDSTDYFILFSRILKIIVLYTAREFLKTMEEPENNPTLQQWQENKSDLLL